MSNGVEIATLVIVSICLVMVVLQSQFLKKYMNMITGQFGIGMDEEGSETS